MDGRGEGREVIVPEFSGQCQTFSVQNWFLGAAGWRSMRAHSPSLS